MDFWKIICKAIKISLMLMLFTQTALADKPALFLLKKYQPDLNVTDWVMSEKLDGVRGFWDGRQLLSRGGKILTPPKWFIQQYPPFAIDGELWTKRADFETASSITNSKNAAKRWREITHQIFEVPNQAGGLLNRLKVLRHYLSKNPSQFIKIIPQIRVKSKVHLNDFLNEVIHQKGEGVVVRNPETPYQTGRLSSALKVKKYIDDECVIVEILGGKGKYTNQMGSVKCQLKNGKIARIGSGFSDNERQNPPTIGVQITFKYYGLTKKGKYKYPVFLRVKPLN
jgi:DNA ligase-1